MNQKNSTPLLFGIILAAILVGASVILLNQTPVSKQNLANSSQNSSSQNSSNLSLSSTSSVQKTAYRDGKYEASGKYSVPGNVDTLDVKVSVTNGIISEVTTSQTSSERESVRYLKSFAAGISKIVVGKNIDEISNKDVVVVNGASLTGKGFIEALENIKKQAKS